MFSFEITMYEINALRSEITDITWYDRYYKRIFYDKSLESAWKNIVFGCHGEEPEDDTLSDIFRITTFYFLQIIRSNELFCLNNDLKFPFPFNRCKSFCYLVKTAVTHHESIAYSDLIKIIDDDNPILFRHIKNAIIDIVHAKQFPQKLDLPSEYLVCRMIKDALFAFVLLSECAFQMQKNKIPEKQ